MHTLLNNDAFDIMPNMPSESIDLILTDPPYNISRDVRIIRNGKGKYKERSDIVLDFGEWDKGSVQWKSFIPEFARLLKPVGVLILFYNKLEIGEIGKCLEQDFGFQVRHIGAMVKRNPAPQARKVKWQNGIELFLIATKNHGAGHHFNFKLGQSPDYKLTTVNYNHYGHPTCKPQDILEWMINYWSYEGDTVFDPFMGVGSTGVACVSTGRKFIGIEIDKKYFDTAKKRMEEKILWKSSLISL